MPYSDFTLKKVKKDFGLTVIEPFDFLQDIEPVTPSQFLIETINKRLSLALANNSPIPIIYGAITSGDRWKFLKLESQTVTIGLTEYNIHPVDKVLGILLSFVSSTS
ncbi:hypothetical protein H6G80_09560 [Nostoc sp. FACHB-87]|uniref:hypothetical protein n=1 Tax=Nostocaceae TaxID=1162 RepID=UPI0016869FF7|nr:MULTISPECIES: hypothetical protein [Nostocaceae]MBD2454324.1 hypothetical protein [Nostoc sp. FACHB-87]MBD2474083.1 hypothetical protein [Anabaena sp. FACHB-83]